MGIIQPGSHCKSDEELRTVGILPSIGHGQLTTFAVFYLEILICRRLKND